MLNEASLEPHSHHISKAKKGRKAKISDGVAGTVGWVINYEVW